MTIASSAPIDLRSDTVTRPTPAMRDAMAAAEVGDDVWGDDPTVNRLQAITAERFGHEAALFLPSGTQSNLTALLTHCQRGDEYIAGQQAHTYKYEGGGGAVFGGIQPQPLDSEPDGTLDLDKVARAIKPVDPHFARTRLLCLENTQGGKVLPLEYMQRARVFTEERGLRLHLDGARVFNAAVALGRPVDDITRLFDSVSVCLSKGLGAPVGSVLTGSREFIREAHRWRKVLGGGMRQAGIIAAAGIFALEHHVERLQEDHDNARRLAQGLGGIEGIEVDAGAVQTNMAFAYFPGADGEWVAGQLKNRGVLVDAGNPLRLVTHLDVTRKQIDRAIETFRELFATVARRAAAG